MIIADFKFVNPQGKTLNISVHESGIGRFTFNRTGVSSKLFTDRQSALLEFFRFVGAICATVDDTVNGRVI